MEVKEIPVAKTYGIRQEVLRPGKKLDACEFDGDELGSTVHFGVFNLEKVVGIVSLIQHKNSFFKPEKQYQLRGMAIVPEARKKGLATALYEVCEQKMHEKQVELIWCNVREHAMGFYKKQGFRVKGELFDILGVGIHVLMFKKLN